MQLRTIGHVVRKHWIVALLGVAVAIVLGAAAYVFRGAEKYSSTATIFVTQAGFPYTNPTQSVSTNAVTSGELTSYAYLYAQLAVSDEIRRAAHVPLKSITAAVVTTGAFSTGSPLPFIDITATAKSPSLAPRLAQNVATALEAYIVKGEQASNTSPSNRLKLQEVNAPVYGQSTGSTTRKTILPGIVFLTVLLATLGLMFALENITGTGAASESAADPSADERERGGAASWPRRAAEPEPMTPDVPRSSQGGSWRRTSG